MTRDQLNFLKERLQKAHRNSSNYSEKEPSEVAAARKIVSKYEQDLYEARDKHSGIVHTAKTEVMEVIMCGDYNDSLAAVKAFEKKFVKHVG